MINSIGTHIKVKDFKKSHAFYEGLGFNKVFEYGPNKKIVEDYSGVVFEQGGGKIEIADGHRAVKDAVFQETINSSKISLMVNVNDVSEIISKAKELGIPLSVGPRHYYWGTLEVVLKDPDGTVLVFISPYNERVSRKIKADETFSTKP